MDTNTKAKNKKELKKLFTDKIKVYKASLDDLKKEESTFKAVGRKSEALEPYILLRLASLSIEKVSTLILMSRLSTKIQGLKNESYLSDARKEISNQLNGLLKLLGDDLDGSLSENKDRLIKISQMTPKQRLKLVQGLKNVTEELKETFGPNSKWRWSFPDLHLKNAILSKNIFDFVELGKMKDPNEEFYHIRQEMLRFITFELLFAAQEYRSRYELSTQDVGELQTIQRIFEATIKIHSMTGSPDEAQKVRNSLDAVTELIESKTSGAKKKKK